MEESKMSLKNTLTPTLFGKEIPALAEAVIDISGIIATYNYGLAEKAKDPEYKLPYYQAKIPAGGGMAFNISTGNEEQDTSVSNFKGIIVSYHSHNVLFPETENGGMSAEPPICQSPNGKQGIARDGDELRDCADCPHNQWRSGKNGGKQCKNKRCLYIIAEGCTVPIMMTLPPMSVKPWEAYKSGLGIRRMSPCDVVTEFSIAVKTSKNGIKYSTVRLKAIGYVSQEMKTAAQALGNEVRYIDEIDFV